MSIPAPTTQINPQRGNQNFNQVRSNYSGGIAGNLKSSVNFSDQELVQNYDQTSVDGPTTVKTFTKETYNTVNQDPVPDLNRGGTLLKIIGYTPELAIAGNHFLLDAKGLPAVPSRTVGNNNQGVLVPIPNAGPEGGVLLKATVEDARTTRNDVDDPAFAGGGTMSIGIDSANSQTPVNVNDIFSALTSSITNLPGGSTVQAGVTGDSTLGALGGTIGISAGSGAAVPNSGIALNQNNAICITLTGAITAGFLKVTLWYYVAPFEI